MTDVGLAIRQLREGHGLTREQLVARMSDPCNDRHLGRYEQGNTEIPLRRVTDIEHALGVPTGTVMRRAMKVREPAAAGDEMRRLRELQGDTEEANRKASSILYAGRGRRLEEIAERLGVGQKGEMLLHYLLALDEERAGAAATAARWLGSALSIGWEERDVSVLREEFPEHFHPPGDLSSADLTLVGLSLIQALRVMMRQGD